MAYIFEKYLNEELTSEIVTGLADEKLRVLIRYLSDVFTNESRVGAAFVGRNLATAVEEALTHRKNVRVGWSKDKLAGLRVSDNKK